MATLEPKWHGPYTVTKVFPNNPNAVQIDWGPDNTRKHVTINVSHLKRATGYGPASFEEDFIQNLSRTLQPPSDLKPTQVDTIIPPQPQQVQDEPQLPLEISRSSAASIASPSPSPSTPLTSTSSAGQHLSLETIPSTSWDTPLSDDSNGVLPSQGRLGFGEGE